MNDEILTVKQTAAYLKLSIKSVHKLIGEKKVLASKVGPRSWRIKKSNIEAFLKANANLTEGDDKNGRND
jgi:excisionase family DNA binding protein